ncbi:hypothetical protein HanIR_Chr14g0690571 [Helianthus annuus]|nr:hypothetical protein HanIR_Chr14g0690571 [Helianthus annuus]
MIHCLERMLNFGKNNKSSETISERMRISRRGTIFHAMRGPVNSIHSHHQLKPSLRHHLQQISGMIVLATRGPIFCIFFLVVVSLIAIRTHLIFVTRVT